MMKLRTLLFFILFVTVFLVDGQIPAPVAGEDYLQDQLILKIDQKHAKECFKNRINLPALQALLASPSIRSMEKIFPNKKVLNQKQLDNGFVNLNTIYRLKLSDDADALKLSHVLSQFDEVEYAEPEFIQRLVNQPSDPRNHEQWYLEAIKAYDAWGISQGDTQVVIGIVDAGADMDHEDLVDNIALNPNDPINGQDDDGDGFVDNYRGWDVANNDNDPNKSVVNHGTNVAGIASAATNNNIGISGCGYNSKLLIVRIDNEITGQLTHAYEGLVYAADQGAFIINNSWGSHFFSYFAQDIVNYAAINRKALVIGASGNDGAERRFYPAAYDNVLSVGSTIENDTVKASSNYGYWLDIFAPGERMLTTMDGSNVPYGINGGTSMAAPVVAGVAALIKAKFPHYSADQIKEQLINTADNIEGINTATYANKLGAGRVNAFRAVTQANLPGIQFKDIQTYDNNDGILQALESIQISGVLENVLESDARNVRVTLNDLSGFLSPVISSNAYGTLNGGTSLSTSNQPFVFRLNSSLQSNQRIEMEAHITADNYSKKVFFSFFVNTDFITIQPNQLETTLTSTGGIGFVSENPRLGRGIRYKEGNSLLFEGSFIVGNSPNYILDNFRAVNGRNNDFKMVEGIRPFQSTAADFSTTTSFNDENETNNGLLSFVRQNHFVDVVGLESSYIETYGIQNTSSDTLFDLYAGLLMDWDVSTFDRNKIIYDANRSMGISYSTDSNLYCGIKLLSTHSPNIHHALDNGNNVVSGINLGDGFTDAEKFTALSTRNDSAGKGSVTGNDVIDLNSIGPFKIGPSNVKVVSFAILVAEDLTSLENKADQIQNYFELNNLEEILNSPFITFENKMDVFPNPTNQFLNVQISLNQASTLSGFIANIDGQILREIPSTSFAKGINPLRYNVSSLKSGVYFIQLEGSNEKIQHKFVVTH